MAKAKAATPAVEENGNGENRIGAMHEAFANYIKKTKGVDINAEQVFAVTSTRVAFRKSDDYRVGVKQAQQDAKAEVEAAKAKAKEDRETARKEAAAKKAAAKAEADKKKADEKAAAEAEAATEAAKKTTAATTTKKTAAAPTAKAAASSTAAKTTKRGKGKVKGESPF